jgi:hypothetical protein
VPGITLQSNGPHVTVKQAPPNVVQNISMNISSPSAAPGAVLNTMASAAAQQARGGMYDLA